MKAKKKAWKPKPGEACIFDPSWDVESVPSHPLKRNEMVYFLMDIPNVPGHCIVARTYPNGIVPMIHPADLRKAKEEEL